MTTVTVKTGKSYDVNIGPGLLNGCGELLRGVLGPCRLAVVTDSTVRELYLPRVMESLRSAGFEAASFAFPAGESSKNMATLAEILEFMAEAGLTRSDCAVALGGGVVGDVTGFAAGCYMRGVRCVQLPTTLLAAVDSSVGGKTAVDLTAGKNLAGLFLQPETVICDTDTLATLPETIFAEGAAEAIKTGILADTELFSIFENGDARSSLPEVIRRCVAYKGTVVAADEFERGQRKLLNLGHTVGHAVEKCSGFTVPHGQAVAVGTAVIAEYADAVGITPAPIAGRIEAVLRRNGLPIRTDFSARELAKAALSDKKRSGGRITLVLPRAIGDCFLEDIAVDSLEAVIAAGLERRV